MAGEGDVNLIPLLQSSFQSHPPSSIKRNGNLWTAVAHIITGVIGSGVLSLAWCIAQLGWIAGPISILLFACVILVSVFLLTDCYMSPDPEEGPNRHRSYLEAVQQQLGARSAWVCGLFVFVSLYGYGIAYTITSAISVRSRTATTRKGMKRRANMEIHYTWQSVVAAVMSFIYSFIGLGLGIAKTIGNGVIKGSVDGISTSSSAEKVWLVSQALGDIAFAYPYSLILFEIQDTLKSPPSESHTMKNASMTALSITVLFYLLCGGFGYASFGDDTPGNLLTGFGFYEPYWLVDLANISIIMHLVGGYQIYSQPLFAAVDRWFHTRFPESKFINCEYNLKVPFLPILRLNLFRLCFRTVYVLSTTGIAMAFPYFNQVIGLIGAVNFWPLAIYFPIKMYLIQRHVEAWSKQWIFLQVFSLVCLAVTLFAFTGSVEGIIAEKFS